MERTEQPLLEANFTTYFKSRSTLSAKQIGYLPFLEAKASERVHCPICLDAHRAGLLNWQMVCEGRKDNMIAKDGHIYRVHPAAVTAARAAAASTAAAAARAAAAPADVPDLDFELPYDVKEIVSYRHNKKKRRD
ncbi:hypothetical protein T492DRAFT_893757, partial [Pavlovales sp. CCMP2436]